MDIPTLTPRLAAIASFVEKGSFPADVGTDHGYLPAFLITSGRVRRAVASDINSAPLARARRTAEKYGVADKIEFLLADGLRGAEKYGVDTVITAGMGGETIIGVLEGAPWLRTRGVKLILQPQTKLGLLSVWLDENGYALTDAALSRDGGRLYPVLAASAGPSRAPLSCAEIYCDRLLLARRDPLLPEYLDGLIAQFSKALLGMERAEKHKARADELAHTRLALAGFRKMKEETEKW